MSYDRDGFEIRPGAFGAYSANGLLHSVRDADRISMPHRTNESFLVAMRQCLPLAQMKLGPEVSGLGSDYFSVSAGFATHTDNDYVQALPGTFMSVWLPLVDITLKNGPLVIGGNPVLCLKGDAVLIDGDTPHRSCAGKGPRPVALFTYIQTGKPFGPGKTQQRAEVDL